MYKEYPKIYILGPMTGYPEENRPAFKAAAKRLREQGYDPISPDELDDIYPPDGGEWHHFMARDVPFAVMAQAGVALPGWQKSRGATLEALLISQLGKPVFEYPSMRQLQPEELPNVTHTQIRHSKSV
jgi:hypothetical protein